MTNHRLLAAILCSSVLAISAQGGIIFLPQLYLNAKIERAAAHLSLNYYGSEVAGISGLLVLDGVEPAQAIEQAKAEIGMRDELVLNQFRIFNYLKERVQTGEKIIVGAEGSFFSRQSLDSLDDSLLVLGPERYPMPRTYVDYVALCDQHPGAEPEFYDSTGAKLSGISPFAIIDQRYSFAYLDDLRRKNIVIPAEHEDLTPQDKWHLVHAGGLSLAISQGIVKHVAPIESVEQEIHQYYRKIPPSADLIAGKDLSQLRVFAFYLANLQQIEAELSQRLAELLELRAKFVSAQVLFATQVGIKKLGIDLFAAVQIFQSKLTGGFAAIEAAYERLYFCKVGDEKANLGHLHALVKQTLPFLKNCFNQQKFMAEFQERELVVLENISGILAHPEFSLEFILIFGGAHDFLRHSSDTLPITVPELFWPYNQRAVIKNAAGFSDILAENACSCLGGDGG